MSKRDEQRKQADRDFEEIRQAIATQSDEWLCDALREIPHRKWIEIEKDSRVAVGILAHRAAARIAELEAAAKPLYSRRQLEARIAGLEKALREALLNLDDFLPMTAAELKSVL